MFKFQRLQFFQFFQFFQVFPSFLTFHDRQILSPAWARRALLAWLLVPFLSGCSSPTTRMGSEPETPENLKIDPNAFGSDHFTFGKRMTIRYANDFVFFFKHCELIGQRQSSAFYLQNEYGCTPPP